MFSVLQCPLALPTSLLTNLTFFLSLKKKNNNHEPKRKKRSAHTTNTKQKSLTKITKLQIKMNKQKTIKTKNARTKQNKTQMA